MIRGVGDLPHLPDMTTALTNGMNSSFSALPFHRNPAESQRAVRFRISERDAGQPLVCVALSAEVHIEPSLWSTSRTGPSAGIFQAGPDAGRARPVPLRRPFLNRILLGFFEVGYVPGRKIRNSRRTHDF